MERSDTIIKQLDWFTILIFLVLITLGWFNIYAAEYKEEVQKSIFDLHQNSGKQLIWIAATLIIVILIMVIDYAFYDSFAYFFHAFIILLLIGVLFFGKEVHGTKAWFDLGGIRVQPSEFAKFSCAFAVAKYLSFHHLKRLKTQITLTIIIGLPVILTTLQGDAGSALVFSAFAIVLYREGMTPAILIGGLVVIAVCILTLLVSQVILIIGLGIVTLIAIIFSPKTIKMISLILIGFMIAIGVTLSVDYLFENALKPHQQNRIKALINPNEDPLGYGWNVTQSKIAIGSGGMWGKGYLQGTQTKYDFVPEQSTDFIFCTLGEEHGWIGSFILIGLFMTLLMRILFIAERQRSRFVRIYGYGVASILFFHFVVNIGMTIGLFPVIGIPLPFFSYGGSSLWSFTILLFMLLKLDAYRMKVLLR